MVIVTCDVEGERKNFFMDQMLHTQLTKNVQPQVQKKDFDYLFIVDGEEGTGKSVLAMQLGKILDPSLNINNIAFTPDAFSDKIVNSKKFQCIIFDEAFTGLSSRAAFSEINRLLIELMMEMRQRNLFVIIVMPTFFMLERYVVLHRARCLFHVYLNKKGKRGSWVFYNKKKMKYIYMNYKKSYSYSKYYNLHGTYPDFYTVDETKYRNLKRESLKNKVKHISNQKYKWQRNVCIYSLSKEFELTHKAISDLLIQNGLDLKPRQIGNIINGFSEKPY